MSLKTHFDAVFCVTEAFCILVGLVEMCVIRIQEHRCMVDSGSPLPY